MKRVGEGGSRNGIVTAALNLTAECGWETTSLQAVRERAGVSNGTLFHHFPSRDDLASAVVAVAMGEHHDDLLAQLHAADSTQAAVAEVVQRHLRWVADNPRLARLLLSAPPGALSNSIAPSAVEANRNFFSELASWLSSRGWTGSPPLMTVVALWLGPAQYYARGWLAAPDEALPATAADLAAGSWHALRPLLQPEDT
jgi:AcrR family transcriptional regulator